MKVTPRELKMLGMLDRVVGNTIPMDWLKPAQRAMVRRMRGRGLISKRNRDMVTWTQLGKRARP